MTAAQRKQRHIAITRGRVAKVTAKLPTVRANAILADGRHYAVRLWDTLPNWWNDSPEPRRMEWLKSFFASQLNGEVPVKVECPGFLRDTLA